jgi:hypothetical protein
MWYVDERRELLATKYRLANELYDAPTDRVRLAAERDATVDLAHLTESDAEFWKTRCMEARKLAEEWRDVAVASSYPTAPTIPPDPLPWEVEK